MARLYLAAEGDDDIPAEIVLISEKNLKKLGISEGDQIQFEDVPAKIEGNATVQIAGVSDDSLVVNQQLYDDWSDRSEWFGTIEVRALKKEEAPSKVSVSEPVSPEPPAALPVAEPTPPEPEPEPPVTPPVAESNPPEPEPEPPVTPPVTEPLPPESEPPATPEVIPPQEMPSKPTTPGMLPSSQGTSDISWAPSREHEKIEQSGLMDLIPEEEKARLKAEPDSIPSSVSVSETPVSEADEGGPAEGGDIDLDSLLDSLIEQDIGEMTIPDQEVAPSVEVEDINTIPTPAPPVSVPTKPAPPLVESTPTTPAPSQPAPSIPVKPSVPTTPAPSQPAPSMPVKPSVPTTPAPSQPAPSIPVKPSVPTTPAPSQPAPSIPVKPSVPTTPAPSQPAPSIPVKPSVPTTPAPSQPAPSIPVKPSVPTTPAPSQPAPSIPVKPVTSSTTTIPTSQVSSQIPASAPQTSYPSAPASYPSAGVAYPAAPGKEIERPEEYLTLTIELQHGLEGKILVSQESFNFLCPDPLNPAPVIFEDPQTGNRGGAIPIAAAIPNNVIRMEPETYESSDITSLQVNVWSSVPKEPPIVKTDRLDLKVRITHKGIGSTVVLSKRNCLSLEVETGDIVTFEDELIGAWGAGYIKMDESGSVTDDVIEIESEIFEATGIGSDEVVVRRNDKTVVPLQSLELGISPIQGDNMWDTITQVRNNKESMKQWLSQFLIFKGLKLRWTDANAAINILSTVPDLKGEILAAPKITSSLQLKAEGLVTFNAILIIDISASMLAPDLLCKNIAPAIEGIKAAMDNEEVTRFLGRFREGVNVPRRLGAAFAALLFLAEKVGRGFGEKVSIIRFADDAEILQFPDAQNNVQPYFDSASGKHGILETAAIQIVDKIGNYKGLATNMSKAFIKAKEVLDLYRSIEGDDEKPCMMILLTDGYPTDEAEFINAINQHFIGNPNLVLYILGIGTTNEKLMVDIASRSGGEFFVPDDLGSLLIWYSKRARDLVVKLKGGRTAGFTRVY
ncbi:MAG: hypothetical protein ACTSRW_07275 [Candidatus Helarchaeota archaeon]